MLENEFKEIEGQGKESKKGERGRDMGYGRIRGEKGTRIIGKREKD